jgi:addiction module RelE/StbE family toxin
MNLARHRIFNKHFKTRILHNKNLVKKFEERLVLFLEKPDNPLLKDHQLTGKMKNYRAFWVTGNIRVIYRTHRDTIELYDIGTHNQVY